MTIKIDDVAAFAGVSKTTVSRVLNKRGYISDLTKQKVNDAIIQLNYRPNEVARQLFKKRTKIVGLIFPTVDNPFFGQLVSSLELKLFDLGYKVLIGNSMNNPEKEKKYLQELLAHQVDGLIVGAHNYDIEAYQTANLPIVAIDRVINNDVPIVSSDNYQGGKLATEALINGGAKIIINTDGPAFLKTPAHKRNDAYVEIMKKNGLSPITYLIDFSWDIDQKQQEIEKMFDLYPEMDGVFATNDMDAVLIWQTASRLGIDVPSDLKIVGYDGANVTRRLLPTLTTIKQPIDAMAEAAVASLVKRMSGVPVEMEQVLPVELQHGQTC
ncbi:LacI family DNA-binding transcriptional regulator [Leuconostoc inhae]|uniref:LacI family DNA-binding transcriptional regulator n=1 Tax=Leuconostoc inhae TaxID=178001 RepID=UPI001C7DBC8A|nr:LacI family DNA-binding transcriptional regulator [Leuconostoc inhae]